MVSINSTMKARISSAVIYFSAGAAILSFLLASERTEFEPGPPAGSVLQLFLFSGWVAFEIAYARLLSDASVGRNRRFFALILNGCAALVTAGATCFLIVRLALHELMESSLSLDLVINFVFPTMFVLAAVTIFSKRKYRYFVGNLAAVLAWPYVDLLVLSSRNVTIWTPPQTVILFLILAMSPLVFVLASAAVFYGWRAAYGIGFVAGLASLAWLAMSEMSLRPGVNSLIALNLSEREGIYMHVAEAKILAIGFLTIAIMCSASRWLPERWAWRRRPLRERTWPALVISFLVLAVWFARSVSPYRIPMIVDGGGADLGILHVEKRGLLFHEAFVAVERDGRFAIVRNNRRLFQYQFPESYFGGVLPRDVVALAMAMRDSSQFGDLHTPPATPLRSWNAEGWYVNSSRSGVLAFTTENGMQSPPEVVDLFHKTEAQASGLLYVTYTRDICLGFCYDPLAGLGIQFVNQRCRADKNGTRCR
jgi:hypothetical protein